MPGARRLSRKRTGAGNPQPESGSSTPGEHDINTIEGRISIVLDNLYSYCKTHPLAGVFRRTARDMLRDLAKFPEDQIRVKLRDFAQVVEWVADAPARNEIEPAETQKELSA